MYKHHIPYVIITGGKKLSGTNLTTMTWGYTKELNIIFTSAPRLLKVHIKILNILETHSWK